MDKKIHTLPDLPYAYDALEPFIDKETMIIHHDNHHAGYVKNLNTALEKYPELFDKSPEQLIIDLDDVPEDIRTAVRNNAGGHVNHTMFWQIMMPVATQNNAEINAELRIKSEPHGKLAQEINKYFGGFLDFKTKFEEIGAKRFGSGWVWLVKGKDGKLDIASTANQDNPMTDGFLPVMGNDVWEHAYYLKYKNMRADYLKAWWKVLNWDEISKRLDAER